MYFLTLQSIIFNREVDSCSSLLTTLLTFGSFLRELLIYTKNDELFPTNLPNIGEFYLKAKELNLQTFYGRNLGFQVSHSI